MSSNVSDNSGFILLLIEKNNFKYFYMLTRLNNVNSEAMKCKYLIYLILYGHLKNNFLIFGLSAGPARQAAPVLSFVYNSTFPQH